MSTNTLKDLFLPVYDIAFRRKKFNNMWHGAFNGQKIRRQIFKDIIEYCGVKHIYETGSFRGNTTLYMHQNSNLKVDSVEAITVFYRYSKLRFLFNSDIAIHRGDSREILRKLITRDSNEPLFFYLDAHWAEDLPLAEEIEIIFSRLSNAIILVDDFKVENDNGYTYDDYGPGKVLNLEYIEGSLGNSAFIFFPISSENETDPKRGCVAITNNKFSAGNLKQSRHLVQYR